MASSVTNQNNIQVSSNDTAPATSPGIQAQILKLQNEVQKLEQILQTPGLMNPDAVEKQLNVDETQIQILINQENTPPQAPGGGGEDSAATLKALEKLANSPESTNSLLNGQL